MIRAADLEKDVFLLYQPDGWDALHYRLFAGALQHFAANQVRILKQTDDFHNKKDFL